MTYEADFQRALQLDGDVVAAISIARSGIDAMDATLPAPAWPAGADGVNIARARAKIVGVLAWLEGIAPAG